MTTNAFIALLLEDEPLIAMDIELSLGAAGFDVTTVMSCADAHSWLDRTSPDIVIVDIELRDGRSTSVANRLVDAKIPFIVHTGDHAGALAGTPFQQGLWIGKPAVPDELVVAARTAVGR